MAVSLSDLVESVEERPADGTSGMTGHDRRGGKHRTLESGASGGNISRVRSEHEEAGEADCNGGGEGAPADSTCKVDREEASKL